MPRRLVLRAFGLAVATVAFLPGTLLSDEDSDSHSAPLYTVSANSNFRSGPGMSHSVITVIPKGATFTLTDEKKNNFYGAIYEGTRGWVYAPLVIAAGDASDTDPAIVGEAREDQRQPALRPLCRRQGLPCRTGRGGRAGQQHNPERLPLCRSQWRCGLDGRPAHRLGNGPASRKHVDHHCFPPAPGRAERLCRHPAHHAEGILDHRAGRLVQRLSDGFLQRYRRLGP